MSLLTKIRSDALVARKAQSPAARVLITLIGEVETKAKSLSPARDLRDDEVVPVVAKFIKNIDETIRVLEGAGNQVAITKAAAERETLSAYLPKQMSQDELEAFVRARVTAGDNLGAVMDALKAEHAGQYDGKLASQVARNLLAAA